MCYIELYVHIVLMTFVVLSWRETGGVT